MKHLINASVFSIFLLFMNVLYALCDTSDDEFARNSWAIKLYALLFENSLSLINKIVWFPTTFFYHSLKKAYPLGPPLWFGIIATPIIVVLVLSGFVGWMVIGYAISRWSNNIIYRMVIAVCLLMLAAGVTLFAIDAAIPFTRWTFEVRQSDGSGWSRRYAEKAGCLKEMSVWRDRPHARERWERPGPGDQVRCAPP